MLPLCVILEEIDLAVNAITRAITEVCPRFDESKLGI
jgi:hypothetical protein